MDKKYILQYGNIAGMSYANALALRRIGVESRNIIPWVSDTGGTDQEDFDRQLPYDQVLSAASAGRIKQVLKRFRFFQQTLRECDLIHYYGSTTVLPKHLDSLFFHYLKKPMIISWAGGDARIVSLARKNNPYFYRMPDESRDRKIRRRLESISNYVRYVATDPELAEHCLPYFEKVFTIFQPIQLSTCIHKLPQKDTNVPVILHVPTHREVKGTKYIEAAIERLASEGLTFDFRLLQPNYTQKQMREKISEADIYVDELRCGSYGITAVEAMASGKPTLVYIREDLVEKYPPELPLVNTNPDTVYGKLKELILDAELRHQTGQKSRNYAEKYHSLDVVGSRLIQIYKEIGWKAP